MKSQTPVSTYLNYLIRRSSFLVYIQLVACLIFPITSSAQNEANNWFFGNGCGVSFNSGAPVAFANSNLNSAEGVSSISDATGNVLMYTDGLSLYNQNDVVMPNGSGLLGGNSSSQSAVIIRKPLSNNLYYLFTADQDAQPDGIRYSIVDMSLNGGLGNITATKNVLLHTPATEKLTAVQHCNKRDVWIIAHGWGDTNYMAWLLTPSGLTTTPVISSLGQIQDQTVIGCMKASPDGKKLAFAVYDVGGSNYVQLSDFNPATGVVSNAFQIPTPSNCYGVEFSPSSQYLYYTGGLTASSTSIAIYQADICAGTNAAVIASVTEVGNSASGFIRTLQLGPDGKLYFTRFAQNWIGVIDNPNIAAPSCGFNVNGVQLSAGAQCKAGLANFNQSFFRPKLPFGFSSVCLNASFNTNSINQAASCLNPIQSYSWLFGDPASGASNTSTSSNPSHTYSSPGNHSVRLIVNYLCSADTLFQNISVNCGPQVQVTDGIVCSGACFSMQASTVGGTPPYTYSWNSGIGSGAGPHSVCPGITSNYIVTVTDALGLTDQDTVTVTVSSVSPYTLATNSVSCSGGSNGSAQIAIPGGPYTYQWTGFPSNTGSSLSNIPAGNYSFIISNPAGCHKNGSVTISQPLPITATITTHPAACSQANGSASVSVSGGTAPYSYSWLGFSQTGSLLNGVSAGNYTLTITDANNCSNTVNFSINSTSGPLASIQLNSPINCHGGNSGSLTAISSGGQAPLSYAWSNGQTSATISNLSAGTYSVTITDANSCQSTDTYTLIDPVAISTTLVTQSASCGLANGSASINVSGAVSPIQVNWATTPNQIGTIAANLVAGNYSVSVTDANGCNTSSVFSISNLPGAVVSISSTPISCSGANDASVTVSVITSGSYQVNWNTGQTGTQLNSVGAGTYSATVTTAAGCVSTVSQVISSPSPLTVNFSSSPASCGSANGSVTANVSGGFAPYTYSWTGYSSVNAANLPNLLAGSYPLTVTDSHGCTISGNASVSSLNGPSILVSSQQDPHCNGAATGSASVNVSGTALPMSILWSNGTSGTAVSGLVAGNYSAVVTDGNGCQGSVSLTLNQPTSISSIVSTNSTTCNAANGSIQLNLSGGTLPYSVNWTGPTASSGMNPIGLLAGNYSASVTDAMGCTASVSATVGAQTPPQVSISENQSISCPGGNNAELLAQVSFGLAPFSFQWNTGQTGNTLTNLAAGNYSTTVTDANGCSSSSTHSVTSPINWSIVDQISPSTCGNPNGSISLASSGGTAPYSCSWSNGVSGFVANQLTSGIYSAVITDNHGCSTNYSGTVNDLGGVLLSVLNQQDASCNGLANGSVSLSVSGGTAPYSIQWPDGSQLMQRNDLLAGTYLVQVTDASNCQSSVSLVIQEPSLISGSILTTDASCGLNNGTATINISGGVAPYSYQWSNGQSINSSISASAGNISVLVTDSHGCSQNFASTIGTLSPLSATISSLHPITCPGGNDAELSVQITGGVAPYSVQWTSGETTLAIQSLNAGNYSATITDASGCVTTATSVVTEPLSWSVQASISSSTCGNPNGSIQLNLTGGTAPYIINWSNNQTGTIANQLLAGTYDAIITDASGCSISSSYTVSDAGGLQLTVVSQTDAHCYGSNDGSAEVQAIGGTAPYVYQWFDGFSSAQRSDLSAGTHSVTVTDANGCSASTQTLISEPTILDGILSISDGTCGLANGSASIQVNGGTLPYFYSWSNSSVLATIAGLSTGSVGVLVTDANGCQKNFSGSVGMAPALQLAANVTHPITCFGSSTGEIQLSGGSNLTVNWSTGQTGMTLSNVSAGTYTAIAQDAGGCSDTVSISISEPSVLAGQLQIQDATCSMADGSASLQITGGTLPYSYSWSTSSNLNTVSGLLAGPVSVQISDANGCQINLSGIVASDQLLQIQSIQVTDASCAGMNDGSAQATINGAVGSVNWNWSSGSTTHLATGLMAGSYQVDVTDAAGCSATANFVVQEPSSLTASINTVDVSCHSLTDGQASLLAQGGTLPYSFAWDGSAGSISNNQLNAGLHQATITDQNGCSVEVDFTINQPDILQAGIETISSVCGLANGSMNGSAIGGTSPYQYIWSTGGNQTQITGLTSGSYTLQVTDAHGCQSALTKSFQDPGAPVVSLIQAQNISCFGGVDGAIEVSTQGGTGLLSLNWSDSNLLGASINGLAAGNYSLIVSDELNCKDTLVTNLSQPDALISSHSVEDVHCFGGSDGAAHLTINGGTQPYSFLWASSTSIYAAQTDLIQVPAGAYQVQITDAHACQFVDSITISEPELLIGSMHAQAATCYGSATGMLLSQASGGVQPYAFVWSNGSQSSNADSLTAGSYSVLITDANGCGISLPGEVMQPEELIVQLNGERALCKGDSSVLIASAIGGTLPYSFNWSGGVAQDQIVWNALETHEEQVIVQDSKGCTDTLKTQLLVYELPRVEVLSAQTSICAGTCAEFIAAAVPGGSYVWSDSHNMIHTGQSVSFCYDDAANVGITLQVTDEHGCLNQWTADSYLTVHPLPEIGFEAEQYTVPLLEALVHFENTTSGALSYIWDFDPRTDEQTSNDISPSYQFTEIGEYPVSLIATNEFGCSIQLQKTITVTEDFAVYFPNAFTPNNDGSNDRFLPVGVGIQSVGFSMQIYNRWGNLVYETKNLSEGWDGNYESKMNQGESASEVFVWQVSLTDFKGLVRDYRGSVTLIR